jgi:hypothetical protein
MTGKSFGTDCKNCTEGFYCPFVGAVEAVMPCDKGFFCPTGATFPTSTCDAGKMGSAWGEKDNTN